MRGSREGMVTRSPAPRVTSGTLSIFHGFSRNWELVGLEVNSFSSVGGQGPGSVLMAARLWGSPGFMREQGGVLSILFICVGFLIL